MGALDDLGKSAKKPPSKDAGNFLNAPLDARLQLEYKGGSTDENKRRRRATLGAGGVEGPAKGLLDFGLDLEDDPLTYIGGPLGKGAKALGGLAKGALRATGVGREFEKFGSWGAEVAQHYGDHVREFIRGAANEASLHGAQVAARAGKEAGELARTRMLEKRLGHLREEPLVRELLHLPKAEVPGTPTQLALPGAGVPKIRGATKGFKGPAGMSAGRIARDIEAPLEPAHQQPARSFVSQAASKAGEYWRKGVHAPVAGIVSLTPWHAMNELGNLAAHAPSAIPEAITTGVKLAKARLGGNERVARGLTQEGKGLGALSGEFVEKQPFFQNLPRWTGIPQLSRFNNTAVWAMSDAARQALAKHIAASGEAYGLEAGGRAAKRMIDYAHPSEAVRKLRNIGPFPTYDVGAIGSQLGGIARNPGVASNLNRATGGYLYDPNYPDRPRVKLGPLDIGAPPLPSQKVAKLAQGGGKGAAQYLRNATSDLIRAPGVGALEALTKPKNKADRRITRAATYGKSPIDALLEYGKSVSPGGYFYDLPELFPGDKPKPKGQSALDALAHP